MSDCEVGRLQSANAIGTCSCRIQAGAPLSHRTLHIHHTRIAKNMHHEELRLDGLDKRCAVRHRLHTSVCWHYWQPTATKIVASPMLKAHVECQDIEPTTCPQTRKWVFKTVGAMSCAKCADSPREPILFKAPARRRQAAVCPHPRLITGAPGVPLEHTL